jgi:hypothetical protein
MTVRNVNVINHTEGELRREVAIAMPFVSKLINKINKE